ncbi:hypothetical protein ES703_09513 [subsurface metagenome]
MVMIFAHEKVREYLLEHGMVYTFRTHHKKTADGIRPQVGRDWATDRRTGKKIADIFITPIEPISSLNIGKVLTKYAKESGFYRDPFLFENAFSVAIFDWARAINALNPNGPTAGWIYRVEVIGDEG